MTEHDTHNPQTSPADAEILARVNERMSGRPMLGEPGAVSALESLGRDVLGIFGAVQHQERVPVHVSVAVAIERLEAPGEVVEDEASLPHPLHRLLAPSLDDGEPVHIQTNAPGGRSVPRSGDARCRFPTRSSVREC